MSSLDRLTIRGFKSICELRDFELRNLNILIGANGAGKSNLFSFFEMLNALMRNGLRRYAAANGGIDDLLFNGGQTTREMYFETHFGECGYRFRLEPAPKSFILADEALYYGPGGHGWRKLGSSADGDSLFVKEIQGNTADSANSKPIYDAVKSWKIYHFHDTGATAPMRHAEIIQDNKTLRPDAANIGPVLLRLKREEPACYREILKAARLAMPFLDDFLLDEQNLGSRTEVSLSWTAKTSDCPMQPHHLSDGGIRFICLATALLQPAPPATILIDEPELGLHPEAITLLAELIQHAAAHTQLIIATQSPILLDHFSVEDVAAVNRRNGQSTFERLDRRDYSEWLGDYSVGELWTKNVIEADINPVNCVSP